jgi:hypothetical protein
MLVSKLYSSDMRDFQDLRIECIDKCDWQDINNRLASDKYRHILFIMFSHSAQAARLNDLAGRLTNMSRHHYLQWLFLVILVGTFSVCGDARSKNEATYGGAVDFGAQLLHLNDGCVSLDGSVKSGTFFDDLKRIDVGNGFEYRKDGRIVTEYPESLTTSIHIAGDQCAPTISNSPSALFRDGSYSLRFQVEWKEGMQMRPAVLSAAPARCIGYSSLTIPGHKTVPSITCELTIESKGVPLDDHLIVSIFAADGTRLTRLAARP